MVYPPSEDSFLLAKEVRKYVLKLTAEQKAKLKILDMGSGSGIQAKKLIEEGINKKQILNADVANEAIKELKKQKLQTIKTNLFSRIKKTERYDLVIFNAPYLPADKYDKQADTTAGKKGYEVITRFLKQAKSHLEKNGAILLLFSSLSNPEEILEQAKKLKYAAEKLSEENMGMMETIFVYKFSKD